MSNELRTRLMDHLDGLLEPEAEVAVLELLARDANAAAELELVKRLRAAIYMPGKVPGPDKALKDLVLREVRRAPRRRQVVRHAASFAAGVLTTLALASSPSVLPEAAENPKTAELPTSIETARSVEMVVAAPPYFEEGNEPEAYEGHRGTEQQNRLPGYYEEPETPAEFARRIR